MAWDTIANSPFISISGPLGRLAVESEDISWDYADGVGVRKKHRRGPVVEWECVRDVDTEANAEALFTLYASWQSTVVTAVRRGITYPNYYVWQVNQGAWITGANAVGGIVGGRIIITVHLQVQYIRGQ